MRVILTGGTGFLGKYLTESLLSKGLEILALVRSKEKIEFIKSDNLSVQEFEIGKNHTLPEDISRRFDSIVHLAWSNVNDVNLKEHIDSYMPAHFNFLEKIIRSGIKNVFVIGTCYEYGMCEGSIDENHQTKPITNYGIAKKELSQKLLNLQKTIDFNLTWARLFYVYGKGQVSSTIYSQLNNALKRGDRNFKMSNGDQLLDYLSINEVTEIFTKLIIREKLDLGYINICKGEPIKLEELVKKWIDESSREITLELGVYPYRDFEPKRFWGDRTYLNEVLKS